MVQLQTMKTKICTTCKFPLPLKKFYPSRTKGPKSLNPKCIECQKKYHRRWYLNNKRKVVRHVQKAKAQRRIEIQALVADFTSDGCSQCPEKDPCCMDAHHLDPTKKDFGIAGAYRSHSVEKVKEELKKCVCVCRNCHSKIHDRSKNGSVAKREGGGLQNRYEGVRLSPEPH